MSHYTSLQVPTRHLIILVHRQSFCSQPIKVSTKVVGALSLNNGLSKESGLGIKGLTRSHELSGRISELPNPGKHWANSKKEHYTYHDSLWLEGLY